MSFRKIIFFISFLSTLIFTIILSLIYRAHEKKEFYQKKIFYKQQIYQQNNKLVENKVHEAINLINTERKLLLYENEDSLKIHILKLIEKMHFENGGYVFINTIEGQALIFDGHIVKGYKDITNITDPEGKRLFDLEMDAAAKPGGDFIYYKFKMMDDTAQVAKVSFIKAYPEWGWLIGAGDYFPDFQKEITRFGRDLHIEMQKENTRVLFLLIIIITGSVVISVIISKIIQDEFELFKDDMEDAMLSLTPLNKNDYSIKNFKELARTINGLLKRKIVADERVKELHKLLESVFSAAKHVGFLITGFAGDDMTILFLNEGAAHLMGVKKDKMSGKKLSEFNNSAFTREIKDLSKQMIQKKEPVEKEMQLKRKNGATLFVNVVLYPRYDDEDISGGLFVLTDITQLKSMEIELKKYQKELELMVEERTKKLELKTIELESKNKELIYLNDLFAGREFRIKTLKQRIQELEAQLKQLLDNSIG